ncbi:hypothetical protein [Nonlabens sp.]|uniref:hypothetical protein n=1 Tax=Nonlabens sp. TaxID=1888209 RepID=UPI0025FBDAED|nr:hypothetical protein [Nonlabens sp.]
MKNFKIIFLFIVALISLFTTAQEKGDIVLLDVPTSVTKVQSLISDERWTNNADFLQSGIKFKVVSKNDSVVKLQALNFGNLSSKQKERGKKDLSEIYNYKIYTIDRADFDANAILSEPRERLSIGLLTLPFKARPQNEFTFDTEFNFNSTLNWSFAYTNNVSINWQIGAGIGTVGLNTSNSLGLEDDEAQDVSTITFLTGIMLQYNKVQAGVYMGVDNINNQSNYQWKSNGNMWFGFGIGYDLFNLSLVKESNEQ